MTASNVFLSLVPFLFVSVLSLRLYTAQTVETAISHTNQIARQVSGSMDLYVGGLENTMEFLSNKLLNSMEQSGDNVWDDPNFEDTLDEIAFAYPEIAGVLIASEKDEYISTGMTRISRDPFFSEPWYVEAAKSREGVILISDLAGRNITTNKGYSVDDVFSLAKGVFSPEDGHCVCVIMVDVKHNIINDSINRVPNGEQGFVFIIDEQGNVVYTPPNQITYRIPIDSIRRNEGDSFEMYANGSWQVCPYESDYTHWLTVGVFSNTEIMNGVNKIFILFTAGMLLIVVLLVFVSFRVSKTLTDPILSLRALMQAVELGNLDVRFPAGRLDELGDLGNSFNHMVSQMDQLIKRVKEEHQQRQNAEMRILREQIKPHFLYNTLDSVNWMARECGAADIVRLVDALTNMFRIGLSAGKDIIPLSDEIEHVSNYLYIQKIRYKDKLDYQINVDPDTHKCDVPKLILQPLVENAIYHGIKEKRGGGSIQIDCLKHEDCVEITILDDGAGMDAETLNRLRRKLSEDSGDKSGFGLYYIDQRMAQVFGAQYELSVESELGKGTTVTMRLPCRAPDNSPYKQA
jgi:two-component system sensor histidine kinase YesM